MRFIFLVSLIILSSQTYAKESKDEWPSGSAMAVGLDAREKVTKNIKQIEEKHNELFEKIAQSSTNDSRLINALKSQHEAWLKYFPTECELVGAASGAGGSWPSTWATICEQDLTSAKLTSISSVIECINIIPESKRKYEQTKCLHQLNVTAKDILSEQFK